MYTVHLKNIILYGKHGVYAKEHLLDAPFSIDIQCTLKQKGPIQELEDTLNYEEVYGILREVFATSFHLLETLAKEIADRIKNKFPAIASVKISIHKIDPPIAGMQGRVGVIYES